MIPVAGSAYTYSYATMGELIAWIIGWDLVLEYTVAAMAKDKVMAGPVYPAATVPVMENNPAPMITPTPNAIKLHGPKTLFRVLFPDSLASACNAAKGFLINNPISFYNIFSDNCVQRYG
jgi:amino acid transporter